MSLRGRAISAVDEVDLTASSVLIGLLGLGVPVLLIRLLWHTHSEFRGTVIGIALGLLGLVVVALAVALLVRTTWHVVYRRRRR